MLRIVTPEEHLAERHGVHIMIAGRYGVGKTSLLRTLPDPAGTLVVDVEHGTLAVRDVPAAHIRPQTWPETRDLIVRLAGPGPASSPNENYSKEHFEHVGGYMENLPRYHTIFVDTFNAAARLCFQWASKQPEATSERGKADLRGAYGLHARELLSAVTHLHSARGLHIVLINALETVTDDYGRVEHRLQMEGQRVPREIPGIVDEIVTMAAIDFGDGKPVRALVCTSPNPWNYPAKDRSGKLDQIEPPDLGKLLAKILPSQGVPSGSPEAPSTVTPHKQANGGAGTEAT